MEMIKTANEMKENADRMMEIAKRKLGEEVFDADSVDTDLIELVRCCIRMYDLGMKLTCEQAEAMDEMDRKLDKVLDILKKV